MQYSCAYRYLLSIQKIPYKNTRFASYTQLTRCTLFLNISFRDYIFATNEIDAFRDHCCNVQHWCHLWSWWQHMRLWDWWISCLWLQCMYEIDALCGCNVWDCCNLWPWLKYMTLVHFVAEVAIYEIGAFCGCTYLLYMRYRCILWL